MNSLQVILSPKPVLDEFVYDLFEDYVKCRLFYCSRELLSKAKFVLSRFEQRNMISIHEALHKRILQT